MQVTMSIKGDYIILHFSQLLLYRYIQEIQYMSVCCSLWKEEKILRTYSKSTVSHDGWSRVQYQFVVLKLGCTVRTMKTYMEIQSFNHYWSASACPFYRLRNDFLVLVTASAFGVVQFSMFCTFLDAPIRWLSTVAVLLQSKTYTR